MRRSDKAAAISNCRNLRRATVSMLTNRAIRRPIANAAVSLQRNERIISIHAPRDGCQYHAIWNPGVVF
jgi:hypothetical protein